MGQSNAQMILVVEDSDDDFFATYRAFKQVGLGEFVASMTSLKNYWFEVSILPKGGGK